ncbi:S8 family serine peptidase [Pseudoalteromonas issachenkonii]|uniref:S8 family serine peptidase n=1 Tax=Pseudoalteromonas issachenkonii TaxID=152297 RepID=A0ABU9H0U8_9GAMM
MKTQVALAVSAALLTVSLSSVAGGSNVHQQIALAKSAVDKTKTSSTSTTRVAKAVKKIVVEPDLASGEYTYIVRLADLPLATYDGSIVGFAATNPKIAKKELFSKLANSKMSSQQVRNELRLDVKSTDAVQYTNYLEDKQQSFLSKARLSLGKQAKVIYQYKNAFNGVAMRLTQEQAVKLAALDGVEYVERERMETMDTDTGPIHIGATQVWQGEGNSATNMGEGVIIGVIDSGVNTDHDSFADIGGDGYNHTNPWGAGNYVGDCAADFVELCNDKLIGVRSYASVTDNYDDLEVFGPTPPAKNGEDYGGHGSHTASTAGGNILKNVPLIALETGVLESDGIVNDTFSFEQISGVAPHANIVAYQICSPGNADDKYTGCPGAAIVAALDDAVADGVDVLNYSISGGGNPWASSTELGFLAAQEAGIFAAVSAGNDGPEAYTTSKNAPWYTVVGASTHGRTLDSFVTFNDESFAYSNGTGPVFSEAVTALPITAMSVDASNFEGCNAFAADSFKDAVAVISRGACAFSDKVTNAADAGATAVIVYNNTDGDVRLTMSGLEATTIPSVAISENSGKDLLDELASTSDTTISIDPAITLVVGQADDMADFSSRGPNSTTADIMTPSVTAPGVSIYAAYNDQDFGNDVTAPSPGDFAFLQGTSMSAPHTSGAGAVLKSAHPTWTPDNIRSALMMTATTDVRKEDGLTPADVFDMGSGSIRVNLATNTGLIMDETFGNYMKANPATGGSPLSLNIPSMTNTQCIDTCTWTRTFTATKDANWTATSVSTSSNMSLTVSPTSFDIKAGETQTLTVTADVSASDADVWNFGSLELTSAGLPDAHLPILVQVAESNLPEALSIVASRSSGTYTFTDLMSKSLSNISVGVFDKSSDLIEPQTVFVEDGDLDFIVLTFDEVVPNVVFSTSSATAPDIDLRVLDGEFNNIGSSAGPNSNESVTFLNLPADTYYIVADSFTASAPGATDEVVIRAASILTNEDSRSDTVSASVEESNGSFDLTVAWSDNTGSSSLLSLKSGDDSAEVQIPLTVSFANDEVTETVSTELAAGNQEMTAGMAQSVSFDIEPNFTNADKVYTLKAMVTEGQEIANVTNDGVVSENTAEWTITRKAGESTELLSVGFDLIPREVGTEKELTLTNTIGDSTVSSTYSFGVDEAAPVAVITGTSSTTEGDVVIFDGSESTDANNDELTYTWTQLSGTPVTIILSSPSEVKFNAPKVSSDETISFQLEVSDSKGNTDTAEASTSIINKSSSGSFGWLMALLTPLFFARRRKNNS